MSSEDALLRSAKAALRRSLASIRMPPAALASASAAVCSVTAALPEWRAARCVACYLAMPHELDVRGLVGDALAGGRARVVLPRVTGPGALDMTMLHAASLEDIAAFPAENAWRIPEPPATWCPPGGATEEPRPEWSAAALPLPDVVLVPGVGFDASGGRVGHGKGYYDAWLSRLIQEAAARSVPRPTLVGICLEDALLPQGAIPMGPTDVHVSVVCTPRGATRCSTAASCL